MNTVNNPLGKVVVGLAGAAKDANDALTGNSGTILDEWNPLGYASKLFGAAVKGVGAGVNALASVTTEPAASFLGSKLRQVIGPDKVDSVINSPLAKALVKEYSTDPDIAAGLGAVNSFASLSGTLSGAASVGDGLSALSEAVAPTAESLQSNLEGQQAMGKDPNKVVGQITQATTPQEIATAKTGLSTVDMSNVKTYAQGSAAIDDAITANKAKVDSNLGSHNETYTPADISHEIKQTNGDTISTDPVADGIKQLQDFYSKTNNPSELARINDLQDKYQNDGLTPKEINDLAREHGQQLNAYNANGEVSPGLSKQGAENTRSAIKATVDKIAPEANRDAIDQNTSDLINTKKMFDEMAEKVQAAQNKIAESGFLKKAGTAVGKVIDFTTGGFLRGMLRSIQGFSENGAGLNALDLQKILSSNLDLLDRINSLNPTQLSQALANPNTLALPAGGTPIASPLTIPLPASTPPVSGGQAPIINYSNTAPLPAMTPPGPQLPPLAFRR